MMIVDTHCHTGLHKYEPIETLLYHMDTSQVARAVLIQYGGNADNTYLVECLHAHPDRLTAAMIVEPTDDGGYVAAGYTYSYGAGSSDAWLLSLDAGGDILWQKTYGGASSDSATERPGAPTAQQSAPAPETSPAGAGVPAVSAVRSSGPGGQNVNKLNTKALLRWSVMKSPSLPEPVRRRLLSRAGRRVTSEGELLITSQRFREEVGRR